VYDTIERSRRRSLREMYLVASTSTTDSEIRQRVLDYLTEGDIAPILERLVEQRTFRFAPWQDEMAKIASATDAHERRGTTARLLASYPDHPGLLAGRALAEAFDPDGDLRQLESSLDAAVVAARERYGGADDEAADFLAWVARRFEHSRRSVVAAVVGVFGRLGFAPDQSEALLRGAFREPIDPGLALLRLAADLVETRAQLDELMSREWESQR
jgi:ATP-dependent DNA helicase RecQ